MYGRNSIAYGQIRTWRAKTATFNRALNSDRFLSAPDASSRVRVLSLAPMNEYVNIKRQSVSHPPISVRPSLFVGGENYFWQPGTAIFPSSVEQRAPRFTTLSTINDRLQTPVAFSRRGRLRGSYYSSYPSIFRIASPLSVSSREREISYTKSSGIYAALCSKQ